MPCRSSPSSPRAPRASSTSSADSGAPSSCRQGSPASTPSPRPVSPPGPLRPRTVPALRRDAENGVGRNFLVQQYLREGDYQVTVAALGRSRGHSGLALEATPLADGGELRAGMPGHFTLPAGQAVVFK